MIKSRPLFSFGSSALPLLYRRWVDLQGAIGINTSYGVAFRIHSHSAHLKMKSPDENSSTSSSSNSWINKDQPTDVSTLAHYKDGGYEDILDGRRRQSDLQYVLRPRVNIPRYKYSKPRTPVEIKNGVLTSDRVKYTVEKLSREKQLSVAEVMQEAGDILEEMAHMFNLRGVRIAAYPLLKTLKALFSRVYVNREGIQQMRKMLHEYPVLLMPTHRSYLDFLLVSYIFYEYDLPMPITAAAMDFKSMKFFGWLMRQCGAFYIRRSFGTDVLYWAVFTEYVQSQLRNGDAPLQFFVEGTRSRTGKSYQPKIGMLSASLESYFKAELPDVMIVPISISYDRIIEESLYAYEVLGIPKPKESASGLLKARSILAEDYGSVHFHIGEPISIRLFSADTIDRALHGLEPRYINNLTHAEQQLMHHLARRIVRDQQRHLVISAWSLVATVLMQSREGIVLRQLARETDWLKRQATNLGAYVDWPGNVSCESIVQYYLRQHSNIVSINADGLIQLKQVVAVHARRAVANDDVLVTAATNVMLASYRNQLLHVFVRPAMVALAVNAVTEDSVTLDKLYEHYCFLEKLLGKEFVFEEGETKKAFDQAVLMLSHSGGLVMADTSLPSTVLVKPSINKYTTFFSQMFEPFLLAYWVLCQHLLSLDGDIQGRPLPKRPAVMTRDAQKVALRLLQENLVRHHEILSLDVLGNGLAALVDLCCMYKDKRGDSAWISPNQVEVTHIAERIGKYIEVPEILQSSWFNGLNRVSSFTAKL